jgi:formate hydrogenlyase transcriptional activator
MCIVLGGGSGYRRDVAIVDAAMTMLLESDTVARYQALLRVSAALAHHRTIADLIRALADHLHAVVPFEYLALVLHDAASDEMQLLVLEPQTLPAPPGSRAPVVGGGPAGIVWQNQRMSVIPLTPELPLPPGLEYLRRIGMTVACFLPLTTAHGRLGVLSFGSSQADDYPADAMAFMDQVAAHVAVALDNTLNFDRAHALETALRGERDRLRLLLDINNLLVQHLDAQALLSAVSASLREVIAHQSLSIAVHDESTRTLRIAFTCAADGVVSTEEVILPVDRSAAGIAFQRRAPTVFDRPEIEEFIANGVPVPLKGAVHRLCCIPLITRHGPIGILNLGSLSPDAFAPADVELLAQISIQIAIALDNALVYHAMEERHERVLGEKGYLEDEIRLQHDFTDVIGTSAGLTRVLHAVTTVAPTDATVLILGETGTGKELVARAVHRMSGRKSRPFVRLSGAAIPSGLLESELFGYERGAFTGAGATKVGRIELADGGTLFLDEVGDVPLDLQPKLLRVLQEREFERLGSTRTRRVDVRVIAATNRELERMVADELFRSDLYYRLHVFPIQVPALRERTDDIPALARHFAERSARRLGRPVPTIPPSVIQTLQAWHWPGNIRELENVIERAVILSKSGTLQVPEQSLQASARPQAEAAPSAPQTLRDVERESILRALRESRGVIGGPSGAAARLGLKRTTLQSMMQKLGIRRPSY